MKIAVTGASGFIGQHVLAELSGRQHEVVAVIRKTSDSSQLPSFGTSIHLDLAEADAGVYDDLGCPDVLIHLAWGGLPNYRSLHHFEQELPLQYQFLRTMVQSGLSSLFVAGTCFEYGMQSGQLHENMPAKPDNPYAFAKDTLCRQLTFLQNNLSFSMTWGRLFYLYGEGQAENSLYPQLQSAVQRRDDVFNMSGGEQLRDYLTVTEVARYIVDLAVLGKNIGVVNICSGQPVSIRSLVEGWIAENNWNIKLNLGHYPYPDYEPMAFWGDQRKLRYYLEFS